MYFFIFCMYQNFTDWTYCYLMVALRLSPHIVYSIDMHTEIDWKIRRPVFEKLLEEEILAAGFTPRWTGKSWIKKYRSPFEKTVRLNRLFRCDGVLSLKTPKNETWFAVIDSRTSRVLRLTFCDSIENEMYFSQAKWLQKIRTFLRQYNRKTYFLRKKKSKT